MTYIKETFSKDSGVSIQIEGKLESESIPSLREVCVDHLNHARKLRLNLEKVDLVDAESLDCLRSVQSQVDLDGLNEYLKQNWTKSIRQMAMSD